MERKVKVSDWEEVRRRTAEAKTLRQWAEIVVSLFGFPREQIAHTPEWNRKVPADMRDKEGRALRAVTAPVENTAPAGGTRTGETLEEFGARIAREHPEWPRSEIPYTPEWYAKVRGESLHGLGDVIPS